MHMAPVRSDAGIRSLEGGEGTNGQFAVDGGDDDRVPARRARAVHDKGIAGKDPPVGHRVISR